jgi:hypothetical protein
VCPTPQKKSWASKEDEDEDENMPTGQGQNIKPVAAMEETL